MKKIWVLFLLFFSLCNCGFSQIGGGANDSCETALPFCTGTLYDFPAGINIPHAQIGPYYDCLTTTPNPAWYYMKIANPGYIKIKMHSSPSKDIDFCCWGPFSSQYSCGNLISSKIVDCSYSASSVEYCNINNAQTGNYYILIITNYSNNPCNIIFEQTGGDGTTDCSILPPPCSSNSPVCTNQTIQLSAQAVSGASYFWWGPAGFASTLQNPSITDATAANAGTYSLRIEVNGQPSTDTSTTDVSVYSLQASAGNDTTIMNGVTTTLHGGCSGGGGVYTYHWEPAAKLVDPDVVNPQTVNLFSTTIFTVKALDTTAKCQASDNVTVNIAGGALAVNAIATPGSICYGASTQLEAIGSGGTGTYTYLWTGPNGFTSNLPNPTVAPNVTSTYQISAYDGYNTVTGSVVVEVIPLPIANAGSNKSIPNGCYTFLSGSAVNGSGNYFYSWSPADKLINANIKNPQTLNLTSTTIYSLIVTDLQTNCVSNNAATVQIEVTGGPLTVNPVPTPDWICLGETSQLHASAGGGNEGNYQYSWSSVPEGFTSSDPNPVVSPLVKTRYIVSVFDGFNTIVGDTSVSIYPQPIVNLPPEMDVCIYDSAIIDAQNPGSSFRWSNGATTQTVLVSTTGIGYDVQTYDVEVTSPHGCKSQGSVTIVFSVDACVGIDENNLSSHIILFPNPAKNAVTITSEGLSGKTAGILLTPHGSEIRTFILPDTGTEKSSVTLDMSTLPQGVYFLRFNNDHFSITKKLVIQ
ncbi:MAG: T9SS type A sorting domain-containing protein [Bacteroidales bacterium]|nr:T9SS type A sorting domain-containing protein [Bacteroidales bacterium]